MARAAIPGRLSWQLGRVAEVVQETERTHSVSLELPDWGGHRAGQHVDIRLTAPDGYQAQRSYSIASAPEDERLAVTVERLEEGEVSPYLVDELRVGDELELRGPIGGYFVWERSFGGPLLLIAGGSGVVPFRSILRHRAAGEPKPLARLLYSARALTDVIYRDELMRLATDDGAEVSITLTREWPADWGGHRGRIDAQLLDELAWPAAEHPLVYICGPSSFVESAAQLLVDAGHDPSEIRTERFGPTGT